MQRTLCSIVLVAACSGGKAAPPPLAAPTGVTAEPGDRQVTILWNAVDGALEYRIVFGISTLTSQANVGNVTSFTIEGLTNGLTYIFAVVAIGPGGSTS